MTSAKKKILILIDWFFPGYKAGGPISSVMNLTALLKNDYEVYILTTDTDHGETKPYENIRSNTWFFSEELGVNLNYLQKSTLSKNQIKKQIKQIDADYIYLNHLYSPLFVVYPLLLKCFGMIKGKVVVCPRGALFESAISVKAYKKRPLLLFYKLINLHKFVLFHATNERERQAIEKYFSGSRIIIADNLPTLHQHEFVPIVKTPNVLNCIFISRIVPIKNLSYLLDLLKQIRSQTNLTIAGPAEDVSYWRSCQKQIADLPKNVKVQFLGPIDKSDVTELIQQNHLFILPTKGENFGHAIFESFLAGRPVLISDQTPWRNLDELNIGWDISLSQPGIFLNKLEKMADAGQDEFDSKAQSAWNYAKELTEKSILQNNYADLFSW